MDDQRKLALAAAVAGGYVLGRTKKGRFALTAVTFVMGRSLEPRQLLIEGVRRLRGVPQIAELNDQLKSEVFRAGRAAVLAAANRRLSSLTGVSDLLGGKPEPESEEPDAKDAEPDEDANENEDEDDEEPDEDKDGDGDEKPAAKKAATSTSGEGSGTAKRGRGSQTPRAAKSTPARKAPAKKAAPAKKTAARKAAAKKPSPRSSRGR